MPYIYDNVLKVQKVTQKICFLFFCTAAQSQRENIGSMHKKLIIASVLKKI